jgi:hypothetical protein
MPPKIAVHARIYMPTTPVASGAIKCNDAEHDDKHAKSDRPPGCALDSPENTFSHNSSRASSNLMAKAVYPPWIPPMDRFAMFTLCALAMSSNAL